jgi:hypothetical protein
MFLINCYTVKKNFFGFVWEIVGWRDSKIKQAEWGAAAASVQSLNCGGSLINRMQTLRGVGKKFVT